MLIIAPIPLFFLMHQDFKTIKLHCFRENGMRSHGMKKHKITNKTVYQQTEARKTALEGKRWHQCSYRTII